MKTNAPMHPQSAQMSVCCCDGSAEQHLPPPTARCYFTAGVAAEAAAHFFSRSQEVAPQMLSPVSRL